MSSDNTGGIPRVLPDQFDPDPALQGILDRLTTYYPRAIDPGLERSLRLLHDLGNPHLKIPPAFHVSGTNGKGSTTAYIRAISMAAGLTCHVMTSPHLVRFNERFVIANEEINTPDLIHLLEEVEDINAGRPTTSFEILTAAGFLAFARAPADISIIEVGMGGRFDATNVITSPLASIITVISRDHTKFLGTELSQIASEKAGIIKKNCPVIIGPQTHEGLNAGVMNVFEENATSMEAPLYRHGHEWSYDTLSNGFILHTPSNIYELPRPNLLGDHQLGNAATASMALLVSLPQMRKLIPVKAFDEGITHARWPGRLQHIQQGPLTSLVSPQWEIWIDGGHNDTGGMVLAEQAKHWEDEDGKPLHIILGMLNTKNPLDFLTPLVPHATSIQTITIPDQPLSFTGDELHAQIAHTSCVSASLEDAITYIKHHHPQAGRILITGSLYLMGHILKENA